MIRYREKLFWVGTALTVGTTALGMGQASKQMKESQKQADQMEKSNLAIAKQLNKIAKSEDPNKMQAAGNLMQQNFSAATLLKSVGGVAKDLGSVLMKNKKMATNLALSGAITAGSGYVADRYIQSDMKKSGKTFSAAAAVSSLMKNAGTFAKSAMKKTPKFIKNHKMDIAMGVGFGGVLPVGSYLLNKKSENSMAQEMENNTTTRTYSAAAFTNLAKTAGKFVSKAKVSAGAAGKKILGGTSSFMGGGGYKGVQKFGRSVLDAGTKSGNATTQKIGVAILRNPNKAVAASIPVGMATMGLAFGAGEKIVKTPLKMIDKNAYKYQESQQNTVK